MRCRELASALGFASSFHAVQRARAILAGLSQTPWGRVEGGGGGLSPMSLISNDLP